MQNNKFIEYLGSKIAVYEYDNTNENEKQVIVLLSANPGCHSDFDDLLAHLLRLEKYRILLLDYPGYGNSTLNLESEHYKEGALFFYKCVLHVLKEMQISRAIFIGNSVGGNIALRIACENKEHVEKVIAVSTGGFTKVNFLSKTFCKLMASGIVSPHFFAKQYLYYKDSKTVKEMLERAKGQQSTANAKLINSAVWSSFNVPEHDLRKLVSIKLQTIPVLFIFGKHDPVIRASGLMNDLNEVNHSLPDAKIKVLDSGHWYCFLLFYVYLYCFINIIII